MSHEHGAAEPSDDAMFSQTFWDERYATRPALWSGNPNPQLVANVIGLVPGTALDLGSGEGADAVWLAQQRWTVTAVDVSEVALDRARGHAEAAGAEVAGRITWLHADVRTWTPEAQSFDLVSEQFLHLPSAVRAVQHERFAEAVRPGGTLLVVGHHPMDNAVMHRPDRPDLFFTAAEEAARLAPGQWNVATSEPRREASDPDGNPVLVTDTVLRAVRLS